MNKNESRKQFFSNLVKLVKQNQSIADEKEKSINLLQEQNNVLQQQNTVLIQNKENLTRELNEFRNLYYESQLKINELQEKVRKI